MAISSLRWPHNQKIWVDARQNQAQSEAGKEMKASSALLGIGLVATSGLAFHFWQKLEEERQQTAISASEAQERRTPPAVLPTPTPEHFLESALNSFLRLTRSFDLETLHVWTPILIVSYPD